MKKPSYIDNRRSFLKKSTGFTLLEVLIALTILSIGLLGLAAMQTMAISAGQGGYLRTQAVWQIYDITDRMRANSSGVKSNYYDNIDSGTVSLPTSCNPCDDLGRANWDAYDWATSVQNTLPTGTATVTGDGTNFTITITWFDPSSRDDTTQTQTLSVGVEL